MSIEFNFSDFKGHDDEIILEGTSKILADGILKLTDDENPDPNTGHALYTSPIHIWDSSTGKVASFVTSFSFLIKQIPLRVPADGIIFFLAPCVDTKIPENSTGGYLGIVDSKTAFNQFIGVEFDNYPNDWDPASPHIGINVNSLISVKHVKWNWKSGSLYQVRITYESLSNKLSVFVTDEDGLVTTTSQVIDLQDVLPEKIRVGFSASTSTGGCQKHEIHSWSFSSNLETISTTSNPI